MGTAEAGLAITRGGFDADRVAFTTGRDLKLRPPQHGEWLNYLIYPYVEVDSKTLASEKIEKHFGYDDRQEARAP